MMDGRAALDAHVARLRSLKGLVAEAMPELAAATQSEFQASAAAGTDPEGNPWPLKKDGGRALINAAGKITAQAVGLVIVAVVSGIDAIHHHGTWKDPRRQILPTKNGMPSSLKESYRAGLIRKFNAKAKA